ncbi:hypothetical protein [Spiroplasma culicicola]|uniref:Uncharacterized protein n=1 Tax=Spiroplasma culicicola AES-1 TaxID=1276246 RepID=W6A667_9MOLU|nr:hypothetical protein [Spiroplasma culicicola]AHI52613.1 hypothetical protein SCULI_v1c02720 [Spiroplasma culicicola AES-1]
MLKEKILSYLMIQAKALKIIKPINKLYELKDFSNNIFYLIVGETGGYIIFDPESGHVYEKSQSFKIPYSFSNEIENFYLGPLWYIEKNNNSIRLLGPEEFVLNKEEMELLQESFNEVLFKARNNKNVKSLEYINSDNQIFKMPRAKIVRIKNYEYIMTNKHPRNHEGSCGFVAASLILYFWYKTKNKQLISKSYLTPNDELNDTRELVSIENNLKDKLVHINDGDPESWAATVASCLRVYCLEKNIKCWADWKFFKEGLTNSIKRNQPAIFFGLLKKPSNDLSSVGSKLNHAVAVYGYEYGFWSNNFIVNFGWQDPGEVILSEYTSGSTAFFKLL